MKITLPLELEQFVVNKVGGGSYLSESEVVTDALRKLIDGEHPPCDDRFARGPASLANLQFAMGLRLGILKEQLAELEITIKEVMNQIERHRQQEQAEQDRIKELGELLQRVMENLNKAAESYKQVLSATTLIL